LEILISEPPSFPSGDVEIVEVMAGDSVILNCNARGYPNPAISWINHDSSANSTFLVSYQFSFLNFFENF